LALHEGVPAAVSVGGGKHTFTLTVNVRGHGCNWADDLVPQAIKAYSLTDALHQATEIPLGDWFPPEDEEG
jgi:hypothetical protein